MTRGGRQPRRTRLTGRAGILAVVVCAIVLSLAYPLREYIAQRHRIAELRAQIQSTQQRIAALEERERRLEDPEYIKRLARERLHFRMPGETNYIVLDGRDGKRHADGPSVSAQQRPWFVNLWDSVQQADGRANKGGLP